MVRKINSQKELEEIVDFNFSDPDLEESEPTVLMNTFGLVEDYEPECVERLVVEEASRKICVLLQGFSCDKQLIKLFTEINGSEIDFEANAVILIFEYNASPEIKKYEDHDVYMQYIGTTKFDRSIEGMSLDEIF